MSAEAETEFARTGSGIRRGARTRLRRQRACRIRDRGGSRIGALGGVFRLGRLRERNLGRHGGAHRPQVDPADPLQAGRTPRIGRAFPELSMWQSAPESVRNSAIAVPFGRGALFTAARDPLRHFFTERYAESYARSPSATLRAMPARSTTSSTASKPAANPRSPSTTDTGRSSWPPPPMSRWRRGAR